MYHEVVVAGRGQPGAAEVEQADWITRAAGSNPTVVAVLHELDRGEAEAVALAVENPGALLILDERRGRLAAARLGISDDLQCQRWTVSHYGVQPPGPELS